MQLLTPLALVGLITLPIIIALHLLRNEREQRPVSSLALWRGLQQKRSGQRFRRLPLTVMLLLQLAIASLLTLSLARPVSTYLVTDPQHTIFMLDMSSSMASSDVPSLNLTAPSRFEAARQAIQQHLENASPLDTSALIALKTNPELIWADTLETSAEQKLSHLAALQQLQLGATGLNLPSAFNLATSLLDPNRPSRLIIYTDGNFRLDPTTLPQLPLEIEWHFMSSQAAVSNQALLNVSAKRQPNRTQQLFARVVNYSDQALARTVQVTVDGREFTSETVQLPAQGEVAQVWNLPAAAQTARVVLMEADALLLDNVAEVWLQNTTRHQVLLISDTPDTLGRALHAQPNVELTIDPITTPHRLAQTDLVVLEGFALDSLDQFLTSPPAPSWLLVNPTTTTIIRNLHPDPTLVAPWLADLGWSGVYFGQVGYLDPLPEWAQLDLQAKPKPVNLTGSLTETVTLQAPLIYHGQRQQQQIVVWTFNLAESNLPARLTFPLLMDATFSALLAPLPPATISVGEAVPFNANSFNIALPDGRRLQTTGNNTLFQTTQQPGLYKIYRATATDPIAGFAAQAGSAYESNLTQLFIPPASPPALEVTNSATTNDYYDMWPILATVMIGIILMEGWWAWRS